MTGRLAAVAALVLWPAMALGHGDEHGRAAHRLGGPVVVQHHRIELLSEPGPLVASRESRIVARITRADSSSPLTGARVAIGTAPAGGSGTSGAVITPTPVQEVTWAGSYTLPFVPAAAGEYRVRVVIVDGTSPAASTVAADFDVHVAAPPGLPWLPLTLAGLIAGGALVAAGWRARRGPAAFDLLAAPWLSRVLTSRALLPSLQLPLVVVSAAVVFLGLADIQDPARNVAPRLVWTIWWAGVIFTLVVAGRAWCVMCPFGALNEWASRASGAWRRLPRVFRNLWWGTALFIALTWADEQLGVVRRPSVTAWIVIGLAALAVAVGLRYERRSFCRYLCPINGVLGLYAMLAPVELRTRHGEVCRGDAAKGCFRGDGEARGCPMLEFPPAMERNNYCTFCLECARGCGHDNVTLRLRAFGRDLWSSRRRFLDEAYLAMVMVGLTLILTARMLPGWSDGIAALARWLPSAVRATFRPVTYLTALESVVLLLGATIVVPALLLGASAIADRYARSGVGVRRAATSLAYMFVPIALALHLAHNLSHLLVEGPLLVPAVQRAVAAYTPWSLGVPDWDAGALASPPVVALLQACVVLSFFVVALRAGYGLSLATYGAPGPAGRALLPVVLLALVLTGAGLALLAQPMSLRHAM